MKQILVSKCGECPFTNEAKTYCYHPDILCDHDGDDRISTDVIHRNCPLPDAPPTCSNARLKEAIVMIANYSYSAGCRFEKSDEGHQVQEAIKNVLKMVDGWKPDAPDRPTIEEVEEAIKSLVGYAYRSGQRAHELGYPELMDQKEEELLALVRRAMA